MDNMELYQKFREVPQEAQKPITGGRLKNMTDINPMWRIKLLTETFGPCGIGWKYIITKKWLETSATNEIAAFVDIELYYRYDGEWSDAIPGTGGSSFVTLENSGKFYISDECFKMALTDAISVSCKSLGIGANIYYQKDRTKYDLQSDVSETQKQDIPKEAPKVTAEQLIELAHKKGVSPEGIKNSYKANTGKSVTDVKFIPAEIKKTMYDKLAELPDKI